MRTMLSLQNVVVLSEQNTPIVFAPDMNMDEAQFFQVLQDTITRYRLPVKREMVPVVRHKDLPPSNGLLISLEGGQLRYSKVLVCLHIFGSIGVVERKHLVVTPEMPPALDFRSSELPARLSVNSPELPAHQVYPGNVPQTSTFKNELHKQRVMMIEQRRQERMDRIIRRASEREVLIEEWWNEVHEIITGSNANPLIRVAKDAVDLMIKSVIADMQEHGAKSKESDEFSRKQEELLEAAKKMRRNF